jgi:hypothetical protein
MVLFAAGRSWLDGLAEPRRCRLRADDRGRILADKA